MNKKISKILKIFIVLTILAIIVFLFWQKNQNRKTQKESAGKIEKVENEKVNQNSNNQNKQQDIDISDWKTYKNKKYGFEFRYPSKFLLEESSIKKENEIGLVVSLKYLNSEATDLSGNKNPVYEYVFNISHWSDINDSFALAGSWEGQRKYFSLEDALSSSLPFVKKIDETQLDNQKAYEVNIVGNGSSYGIMYEKKGIWRVEFPQVYDKKYLGSEEMGIISSYKINE